MQWINKNICKNSRSCDKLCCWQLLNYDFWRERHAYVQAAIFSLHLMNFFFTPWSLALGTAINTVTHTDLQVWGFHYNTTLQGDNDTEQAPSFVFFACSSPKNGELLETRWPLRETNGSSDCYAWAETLREAPSSVKMHDIKAHCSNWHAACWWEILGERSLK